MHLRDQRLRPGVGHLRAQVVDKLDAGKTAGVDINRKVLADLAVQDIEAFGKIAELAKGAQS